MKTSRIKTLSLILLSAVILTSCEKDEVQPQPVQLSPTTGALILSEGGATTRLALYNNATSQVTGDYFLQQNPSQAAGLGSTGNDMIVYGSKLYIVMNGSGNVTVLNAANGIFIKRIDFTAISALKTPRYATSARGKVFVSSSDNTVSVIDTTSLNIIKSITVGNNPEGLAANSNFLYVANSGGFNFPNVDSTVSVVDLNTETEIRKIVVGKNPYKVDVTSLGNIYVSAYGNFGSTPGSISVINPSNNMTSTNLGAAFNYSNVRIFGDIAYFYNNYQSVGSARVYNTATNSVIRNEFITDGTAIAVTYGLNIDEQNGDVYIADAVDFTTSGRVTCFTAAGIRKFSFSVSPGVNPNKILFRR